MLNHQQNRLGNPSAGFQIPTVDGSLPSNPPAVGSLVSSLGVVGQQGHSAGAGPSIEQVAVKPESSILPDQHKGPLSNSSSSGNSSSNAMEGDQGTEQSPHNNEQPSGLQPDEPGVKQKLREKNRNAQRRFRERQKAVVLTLQLQVDLLTRQLDELRREKLVVEEQNKALVMQLEHMESLVRPILVNQLTSRPS